MGIVQIQYGLIRPSQFGNFLVKPGVKSWGENTVVTIGEGCGHQDRLQPVLLTADDQTAQLLDINRAKAFQQIGQVMLPPLPAGLDDFAGTINVFVYFFISVRGLILDDRPNFLSGVDRRNSCFQ